MTWFKKHDLKIMMLTLIWFSVSVYTCSNNAATQIDIKLRSYTDNSVVYTPSDIVMDGSMNQYLVYSGASTDVHVSRINSDRTNAWSKRYVGFYAKFLLKSTQISSNGDSLVIIGEDSNSPGKIVRINTTDGSILNSININYLRFTDDRFQTTISCSSTTSTICYMIAQNSSSSTDQMAIQVDFTNTTELKYADPNDLTTHLSSIVALNDEQMIAGGFDLSVSPPKYLFFNHNFSSTNNVWMVESAPFEGTYTSDETRAIFSSLNDNSSKLVNIMQTDLTPIVIVLNPADGTLIDARKVEYNLTYGSNMLRASGKVANDTFMVSFVGFSPDVSPLVFINTETWAITSYISKVVVIVNGFTPLFNTSQIIMLMYTLTPNYFTLQVDYDKLNATELFDPATYSLADINGSLGFTTASSNFTQATHTLNSFTPTVSDIAFNEDPSKTYEATANFFSSSGATLEGDTKSTSLGPIELDCYSVSNSAFSNQLSMTQSDGQAIPSWMAIDSSSATVSLTSPEVSSGSYTVTNTFVGVAANFTSETNVTINIVQASENEDDHCLGASSEGLCGFFVTLIILGVLAPVIFIAILIYVKFIAPSGPSNMTKLDQEQPDEGNRGNENDNDVENDESVGMNQNNQAQPNMDNGTVQHAEHDGEVNQV